MLQDQRIVSQMREEVEWVAVDIEGTAKEQWMDV